MALDEEDEMPNPAWDAYDEWKKRALIDFFVVLIEWLRTDRKDKVEWGRWMALDQAAKETDWRTGDEGNTCKRAFGAAASARYKGLA